MKKINTLTACLGIALSALYSLPAMCMEPNSNKRNNSFVFTEETSSKKQKNSGELFDDLDTFDENIDLTDEIENFYQADRDLETAFFTAIEQHDTSSLQAALKKKPELAQASHETFYTTTWEDIEGNIEKHTRTQQWLPLAYAIKCNNAEAFTVLINQKATFPELNNDKHALLRSAIQKKNLEIFKALFESKQITIDINQQNDTGSTLLHYAFFHLAADSVLYLIDKGANTTIEDDDEQIAAHAVAYSNGKEQEIIDFLLATKTNVESCNFQKQSILHQTIASTANIDCVKALLRSGADVNAKDRNGKTPLHFLTSKIEFLENFTDEDDAISDMVLACKKIASLLVAAGADIHATTNSGETPLDFATQIRSSNDLAKHLINLGAGISDINIEQLQQISRSLAIYIQRYRSFLDKPTSYKETTTTLTNDQLKLLQQSLVPSELEGAGLEEQEYNSGTRIIKIHPHHYWFKVANYRGSTFYVDLTHIYNELKSEKVNKEETSKLTTCLAKLKYLDLTTEERAKLQKTGIPLTNNEDSYKALLAQSKNNKTYTDTIIKYQ